MAEVALFHCLFYYFVLYCCLFFLRNCNLTISSNLSELTPSIYFYFLVNSESSNKAAFVLFFVFCLFCNWSCMP